MGSPKFQVYKVIECRIKFCIQPIPTLHTFEVPTTPKNKNYSKTTFFNIKKCFFIEIFIFGCRGTSKVCSVVMGCMKN